MLDVKTARDLSAQDFASLGLGQVAYLRQVTIDGTPAITIHAANGQALGAVPTPAAALAALRDNELDQMLLN
ncbi:MAG: hypothetical protein AAFY02_10225 [Pseudomonadota bacterium]